MFEHDLRKLRATLDLLHKQRRQMVAARQYEAKEERLRELSAYLRNKPEPILERAVENYLREMGRHV